MRTTIPRILHVICTVAILFLTMEVGAQLPGFTGGTALVDSGESTDPLIQNVQPISPREDHWSQFLIKIWQYQTKAERDLEFYRDAGFRGFHIDGGAGKEKTVAFAQENNLPYYVDHLAGKGYLHLTEKMGLNDIERKHELVDRPQSLVDPATIDAMHQLISENVKVTKNGPVVAYSFDDEISLGTFNSPAEVDNSPRSIAGFREWLKEKYGSIEGLNRVWSTTIPSLVDATPVSFEEIRSAHSSGPFSTWTLARWMDWRAYMDSQFASSLGELTRFTNSLDSATPAGFVGGQQPSAFGGYDYEKLCRSVQFMEAYDIGGTNEILRSFWGGIERRPFVQTWFSTGNVHRDSWFLWYYLAHGSRGVIAWPQTKDKRLWFQGGKGLLPHFKELASTCEEIQGPVSKIILAPDTRFNPDPIAVYYSMPSIRASWVTDVIPHGRTWPNRSSGLDNQCQSAGKNRVAWFKLLEDCGFQYNVVSAGQVAGNHLIKEGYRVLILNRAMCLSDNEIAAMKRFVDAGGTIIADHWAGVLDENGNGRKLPNAVDELFSLSRTEVAGYFGNSGLCELNGERYEAPYLDRLEYKNARRDSGIVRAGEGEAENGHAIYLDRSPLEYWDNKWRVGPGGDAWRSLVTQILKEKAGLQPRVRIMQKGKPVPMVEAIFWKQGDRNILAIVMNPARQGSVTGLGEIAGVSDQAIEVELVFSESKSQITNLRTGKTIGKGKSITIEWKRWEALLLEF